MTLAQIFHGVESSFTPSSTVSPAITNTADSNGSSKKNTPAIIGGVVGGIAGLGLLVLTLWLLLRKRKSNPQTYTQSFQLNPTTGIAFKTTPSFPPVSVVPAPGSPYSFQVHVIWYTYPSALLTLFFRNPT